MKIGFSIRARVVRVLSLLALGTLASAGGATAQTAATLVGTTEPSVATGYLNVSYLYEASSQSFQETLTQSIYGETATYTATHAIGGGGGFDVGGGYRVGGNLAVGIAVASRSKSDGLLVEGEIPHPLFFDRHRSSTLARSDLDRTELGIHLQAVWMLPVSEVLRVSLFAGPSIFNVGQDYVSAVDAVDGTAATENFSNYDEVTIPGISTSSLSGSGFGVNAGADVTYMFTERLGGRLFGRWAGGNVELATSGGAQSVKVGGFQTGVGIRIRF
ncbi:MAG: hypothetical protein VX453_09425 [Acidobacteriota bacterium]|nr:hypothetical protein [Acidobacteriota bacterium]